jgi:hypothetical protein
VKIGEISGWVLGIRRLHSLVQRYRCLKKAQFMTECGITAKLGHNDDVLSADLCLFMEAK